MIIPELAGAAARELDGLRTACADVIGRLLATGPDTILVLGPGAGTVRHGESDHGSLRPYGLDRVVSLGAAGTPVGPADLPLSLLVGAWLLHRAGARGRRGGQSIAPDASVDECRRIGGDLTEEPDDRVALLVMGDGSACRGERSPGYDDPAAEPYDDAVAAALAGADATALLGLDPELSARLRVTGRTAWQALAAAVARTGVPWQGDLSYYAAPYGVSYFVANWTPVRSDRVPG
ncbi:hypothetical protein I0C86_30470 [Plantactinospora sp. S1510]|uniref:Catalytic LigB subunit of aromatic ring-opening dioxygenase n=1 Tax=Plantactinospora alkalitolerans TaxID=2789879 RepID=A0ABS0H469_9ACTN|nr:hypothetical protein [Plantactinospora alkalitolerans]MBF9133256.1 hypothetical protein [Plantactinospora alkalitolerans]